MENINMEFIVNKDWRTFKTNIYLRYHRHGRPVVIGQKDGFLIEQQLSDEPIPQPLLPLLQMDERMADDFIKAVVDYASDKGIKTENENLLKGKLAATEKHLEDLRAGFAKLLDKVISIPTNPIILNKE